MSNLPSTCPSDVRNTHPGWCSPKCCTPTERDVEHRSAPVALTAGHLVFEFRATQVVDLSFPGDLAMPYLSVEVTDRELEGRDCWFQVAEAHLDALIERLTIERNRIPVPVRAVHRADRAGR